jgi:hypothetical protein
VGGELLVPADQLAEAFVLVGEWLEANALGRALDLHAAARDDGQRSRLELEHRPRRCLRGAAVGGEGVRVEPAQVGEAP